MLNSIQLENFKAFGRRTTIPLAPITLIFGENSAGKSSILQSLNLLKQTRENRGRDALLLPRSEQGYVDLGSFQELLFDHDLSRSLSIRLDIEPTTDERQQYIPWFLEANTAFGLEFSFSLEDNSEINLERLALTGAIDDPPIAEFEGHSRRISAFALEDDSDSETLEEVTRELRCSEIYSDNLFWMLAFDRLRQNQARLCELLRGREFEEGNLRNRIRNTKKRSLYKESLEDWINFLEVPFTYEQFFDRMVDEQLGSMLSLDGFLPVGFSSEKKWSLDAILARALGAATKFRKVAPSIGVATVLAGKVVERQLQSLFPLGPFRRPPTRWYIFTGTTPRDVGYQGHLLPDLLYRNDGLLSASNRWLDKLEIGYEIAVNRMGPHSDLFELRLTDKRRSTPVSIGLSDVGFGVSQILPLVVQSLASRDQLISIEQPEVHIHPRLQADLGDLFIEGSKPPHSNQFLLETHSEHLTLRLLRRVRERKIAPHDISILYVSRQEGGAEVRSLQVDEDGDFVDGFPGGFFPERLRELR